MPRASSERPPWFRICQNPDLETVHIFAPQSSIDLTTRLELSRGTAPAETIAREAYVSDARVASPPWRAPSTAEMAVLRSESASLAHRLIGIVRILDDESVKMLCSNVRLIENVIGDEPEIWSEPVVELLLDLIENECTVDGPLYCHGVAKSEPGLHTVTYNAQRAGFLGLHFDSWEKLALPELPTARNRISVNLGPGDRYFLFFNLHAAAMRQVLAETAGQSIDPHPNEIGTAFMKAFPEYPVVRLRLAPGEAYVAPTDFILHDGSSAGASAVNHQITLRGHFTFQAGAGAAH